MGVPNSNSPSARECASLSLVTILVNYKTADMIASALDDLIARHTPFGTATLIIVDNNSGADDVAILEKAAATNAGCVDVKIIAHPKNDGFGAGNNVGIGAMRNAKLDPDLVMFLNPDAMPQADCLEVLARHLTQTKNAGIAGPLITGLDGTAQASAFRYFSIASEFESTARTGPVSKLLQQRKVVHAPMNTAQTVDWVSGAAFMMTREALSAIDGFDEDYFLYFEETDLMRRLKAASFDIWHLPRATTVHLEGQSTGIKNDLMQSPHWLRSRNAYFKKHHGTLHHLGADLAFMLGTSILLFRKLVTGKSIAEPRAQLREFLTHFRKSSRLQ